MEDSVGAWSEFCQRLLLYRGLMQDLHSDGARRSSTGEPSARSVARLARWGADGCAISLPHFIAAEKRRPVEDRAMLNPILDVRNGVHAAFPPNVAVALVRAIRQYDEDFRPAVVRSLQEAAGERSRDAIADAYRSVLDRLPEYYPAGMRLIDVAALSRLVRWEAPDPEVVSAPGRYSGLTWRHGETWTETLATQHGDLVVLGDPGFGKSTILKMHALALTDAGRRPAYAHLTHFAARLSQRLRPTRDEALDALVAAVLDGLVIDGDAETSAALRSDVATGRSEVLLDGWDEVTDHAARKAVERGLQTLALPGRVIVASRITGYTPPLAEAAEFVISTLGREQITAFIDLWHRHSAPASSPKSRLLAAMQTSSDFASLMEVPVLAGFSALIASHSVDMPTRRAPLYARAIELLLSQVWKKDSPAYSPPNEAERIERIEAASYLAWSMATGDRSAEESQDWGDEVTWRLARTLMPANLRAHVNPLFTQDGLLVRAAPLVGGHAAGSDVSADAVFIWLHRTIQEYLCAEFMYAKTVRNPESGMVDAAQRSLADTWFVVLELYAGILSSRHPALDEAWRARLWTLHQHADPADRYGLMLLSLMDELPGRSPVDQDVVDFAFATDHAVRYRLDLERAARTLLETPLPGGWVSAGEAANLLAMDPKRVREILLEFIETDGGWGGRLENAKELASLDLIAAQRVVVEHLVRDQPFFPGSVLRDLPDDLTARLVEGYERTPWPRRIRLAQALAATGRADAADLIKCGDPTDVQAYLIARTATYHWPDDEPQRIMPPVEPAQLLAPAALGDAWTQVMFAQIEPETVLAGWDDATDWMRIGLIRYPDHRAAALGRAGDSASDLNRPDACAPVSEHLRFGVALLRVEASPDPILVPALLKLMQGAASPTFRWADNSDGPNLDWDDQILMTLRAQDPHSVFSAAVSGTDPAIRLAVLRELGWQVLRPFAVELTEDLTMITTEELPSAAVAIGSQPDLTDTKKALANILREVERSPDPRRRRALFAMADRIAAHHRPRLWKSLTDAWTTSLPDVDARHRAMEGWA
ncbi:hypothetical protein AB0H36_41810 [Kribbella sp. NPDC050820]|uniref:NACHT domain-containing protein n=1 Tax=Kribbella sp. NPDC050820 TaxID=3155408 RepID=UPI0033D75928